MSVSQINNLDSSRRYDIDSPGLAFINKLEKHIDDYKKGHGNISKEVSAEIGALKSQSGDFLARTNPKAFSDFGAYSTMLPYDRQARYISQVSQHARTLDAII